MSRDSYSICRPCGVYQDNGVVVGRVTADWHPTLASFDAQMVRDSWPADGGNDANRLIRKFLIDHEAHGPVEYWSSDWTYEDGTDEVLEGLTCIGGAHSHEELDSGSGS